MRNLEASHGLVFSHRLLLALVEPGLPRDDAYRLVQRNAMRAWDEELDFATLARADVEIAATPRCSGARRRVRPRATIANLDRTFDRLRRLAPKEEPAHA